MTFYTEAQLQDLMVKFDIPPELAATVASQLQTAAERWFIWRNRAPVEVKETRKALTRLSKCLSATTETFRSMPEEVWRALGNAPHWFHSAPNEYRVDGSFLEDEALNEVTLSVETGPRHDSHSASVSEIAAMLDALAEHAHYVEQIEGQFHGKRGPKRDVAFNEWARLIRVIWSSTLGREFKYFGKDGQAISQAAQFCSDAYRPLDEGHKEEDAVSKLRSFLDLESKDSRLHNW